MFPCNKPSLTCPFVNKRNKIPSNILRRNKKETKFVLRFCIRWPDKKIALERTSIVILIWKSRLVHWCFFAPISNYIESSSNVKVEASFDLINFKIGQFWPDLKKNLIIIEISPLLWDFNDFFYIILKIVPFKKKVPRL